MRKLIWAWVVVSALFIPFATPAMAGPLEDGIAAADRGDWKAAFLLLKPLADQGNPDAQNRIGYMYAFSKGGVPQDYAEAMKWYRKAADQGIAGAQSNIGVMYAKGEGVPQDYAEAIKWYRKAADQGNAVAQTNLGYMYANGQGVPKDNAEAIKWYRKAADQGNADAQNNLRIMEAAAQVNANYKNLRIMENGLAAEKRGDWKAAFLRAESRRDWKAAFLLLEPLAKQGNPEAQFQLGLMYSFGNVPGMRPDYVEGTKWCRKAAVQGNADAQDRLGNIYESPSQGGIHQDYAEALKWYRKAADQGKAHAQLHLGLMYEKGQGVPQDSAEAMKWYRKAAAQGNAEAMEWYRKAADQGNAVAQNNLGSMYANGEGVLKDNAEAMKWWRKAADQGNADAQNNLRIMQAAAQVNANAQDNLKIMPTLEDGLAAEKRGDWKAAFLLLKPLAEQGNAVAQLHLGIAYEYGKGVSKDHAEAMKWYRGAADRGNAQAQTKLGIIAKVMLGPNPTTYAEAIKWFRKAADQGYAAGQFELGYMYHDGKGGVPQDYAEAMKWFRKAADQGNADAQINLGSMYYVGQGVPQDYAEAMKWYRKAADQGDARAQKLITRLSEQMAKSTIADVPDPALPDPEKARAALSFLERQMTISQNMLGDPEPGLASIQRVKGALCHLRCGFHLAVGFGEGGVVDAEIEFALSDINIDTIIAKTDAIGRAIISFGTSDGSPRFSRRDREMDMKQNVLSEWSKWESTDKGECRAAHPDQVSLERAMNALIFLAKSCGAKESPF